MYQYCIVNIFKVPIPIGDFSVYLGVGNWEYLEAKAYYLKLRAS